MKRINLLLLAVLAVFSVVLTACEETTKPQEESKIESVVLSSSELTLEKGATSQLTFVVFPDGVEFESLKWSADNANVTVDENGLVTAVEIGESVVTLTVDGVSASCNVTVVADAILPESVAVVPDKLEINAGKFQQLEYSILPENVTDKSVTWSSDNEEIVTVNEKGKINALKKGTAHVKATTANGIEGICEVTVIETVVEHVYLEWSGYNLAIDEMDYQYIDEILPANATDKTLIWTSDDENIATVEWSDEVNKAILKAVSEGQVTIWATAASNPDAKAETEIYVGPKRAIPFRLAWDWILIECNFQTEDGEELSETEYLEYLQNTVGMSSEEAQKRVDMLERYVSVTIDPADEPQYLAMTITQEDGTTVTANSTSVNQVRRGDIIFYYESVYDFSGASQEIQDMFTNQEYLLDDMTEAWDYNVTFADYDVTVLYTFRSWGKSILD